MHSNSLRSWVNTAVNCKYLLAFPKHNLCPCRNDVFVCTVETPALVPAVLSSAFTGPVTLHYWCYDARQELLNLIQTSFFDDDELFRLSYLLFYAACETSSYNIRLIALDDLIPDGIHRHEGEMRQRGIERFVYGHHHGGSMGARSHNPSFIRHTPNPLQHRACFYECDVHALWYVNYPLNFTLSKIKMIARY